MLSFLGEPYTPQCLIPLRKRINSSDVPADFTLGEPDTDPLVVERATRLSAEIETTPQPSEVSKIAVDKIEALLSAETHDKAILGSTYAKGNARAQRLAKEIQDKRATIPAFSGRT